MTTWRVRIDEYCRIELSTVICKPKIAAHFYIQGLPLCSLTGDARLEFLRNSGARRLKMRERIERAG